MVSGAMGIGWVMFGKAVVLAIYSIFAEKYVAWKAARGVVLTRSKDGVYRDRLPMIEARAKLAGKIALALFFILGVAAVYLLFTDPPLSAMPTE